MSDGPTVRGFGLPDLLWQAVHPRLVAAVAALEMGGLFAVVTLAADDLPGADDAWYRLLPGAELVLSCHPEALCGHRPLRTTEYPAREVWELFEAPRADAEHESLAFSAERTDAFLHHHLLTVRDLRVGELRGLEVSGRLAEAVDAIWAVTVDGRLARAGLPGYGMAERRGRFSRLFSAAGIMLPEHWQIFQSLWDGATASRRDVLDVARQLPRL